MHISFELLAQYIFQALILTGMTAGIRVLSNLRKSVDRLHTQVGVIIEKTSWHEKAIDRHEQRLTSLEGDR